MFKDITPVLADGKAFSELITAMTAPFLDKGITKVAGIEARGFTLATPVAERLGAGFIPIRKPGKLPFETVSEDYELEYGIDTLEIHTDVATPGEKMLLVDDVIATGGTAAATVRLVESIGGVVAGLGFVIELAFLGGATQLGDHERVSLLTY